jgi:anti-sigma factor RsiW
MHCDRAQEFFSDYLERTLDRPMTVALEAHLGACAACREEIETLQATFMALDSTPEVEPPVNGAWEVMRRLRDARAEQLEAERRKAPSFLEWLRSLSPLSVGMTASLATLVIGGTVLFAGLDHKRMSIFPVAPSVAPAAVTLDAPSVQVSFGQVTATGQQVNIQFSPTVDLPNAQVRLLGASLPLDWQANGDLGRGQMVNLPPVELPRTSPAEAVRLVVDCPSLRKSYGYLVVVPLGERKTGPVTLFANGITVEEGLRRVAPYLSRPVVMDGMGDGQVNLQFGDLKSADALQAVAEQAGASVKVEGGSYRLVPGTSQ